MSLGQVSENYLTLSMNQYDDRINVAHNFRRKRTLNAVII